MQDFGTHFRANLMQNLTQEELLRLDELITPELAALAAKAFGPDVAPLFAPFIENDQPIQDNDMNSVGIQSLQGRY